MYAETVEAPVDRHIAPLVDAINRTGEAMTYSSCSGHLRDSGFPFVAFMTDGWEFVGRMRHVITEMNEVTRGQTLLELGPFGEQGRVRAVIRFRMYPWLWAGRVNLAPLAAQIVFPPRRLVRLWWAEIEAMAGLVATGAIAEEAADHFASQQASGRGYPAWGDRGVVLGPAGEAGPAGAGASNLRRG